MFVFNHTCPIIDGNIESIKSGIEKIIEYLNPLLYEQLEHSKKIEKFVNDLYTEHFDTHIEEIRQTNIKMRDSAETQLIELEEKWQEYIKLP